MCESRVENVYLYVWMCVSVVPGAGQLVVLRVFHSARVSKLAVWIASFLRDRFVIAVPNFRVNRSRIHGRTSKFESLLDLAVAQRIY